MLKNVNEKFFFILLLKYFDNWNFFITFASQLRNTTIMGMRLHAAKLYKVEWNNERGFNYRVEEFHGLLRALGIEYSGETWDSDFDADVTEWERGINVLKGYHKGDDICIDRAINNLDCDVAEIIKSMQALYDDADKDDGYLHLSFF